MSGFPWPELRERCVNHVADTLVGDVLPPDHNSKRLEVRAPAYAAARGIVRPKAEEHVNALSHLELLELIGEVVHQWKWQL